ncbi:hypothetical protein NSK_003040 [Nannochloropsis salina CCMP1776]|jgi:hypothetical protein|uniref:C3H1-type domain-containing protein n=1 Tax=Nannochloropsis salina CCMP1776 TaxID=1027361 RepID=A0A4D9D277_9STRA|nr:hypothetical protein NSK_003040 [Nannochloropsis salina CCMP1776]|eukprot:TFJ85530.1 hypothetical protein NSK_003040 [Nannochloropsis salina CCMP1776]
MLFFDLVDVSTTNGTRGDQIIRLECLLRSEGLAKLQKAEAKRLMYDVSMGDILEVEGFLDTSREFLVLEARALRVIESWKALHKHNPRLGFALEWPTETPNVVSNGEHTLSGYTQDGCVLVNKEGSEEVTESLLEKVCKYWVATQGRCYSANGCPNYHPPLGRHAQYYAAWLAKRRRERARASHLEGDGHSPEDKSKKAFRAILFADWLVKTYGRERLAAGSGVVDVAGGKGDVSCRLWGKHQIRCTIVDPRETQYRKKVRRQLLRQGRGLEGIERVQCTMPTEFGRTDDKEGEGGMASLQGEGLRERQGPTTESQAERLWDILRRCSMVVGMHPDQATDVCFDAAFAFKKPVACLPCCVFAREFPHRRRPRRGGGGDGACPGQGEEVETYEHLVEYLLAKPVPWAQGQSKREFLPFLGRNQVVYWLPPGLSDGVEQEERWRE